MKKQFTLLVTMLLSFYASGQQKLEPLDIGDQIPNLKFENVLNHPSGEILLSDYRGKLLILDFWATWCAPCVASFPKLDSLDKAFGEDLVILPVTYQSQEEVEKLFNKVEKLKSISLPMLVGDNSLVSLFPHQVLPHYVWIGREGEVLAFTESTEITYQNIKSFLEEDRNTFKHKDVVIYKNHLDKPFFESEMIDFDDLQIQSTLTGYIEGISGGYKIHYDDQKRVEKLVMTNVGILQMFKLAYGGQYNTNFSQNRIRLNIKDKGSIKSSESGQKYIEWQKSGNGFCYELNLGEKYRPKAFEYMIQDLNRVFPNLEAHVSNEEIEVWALEVTDKTKAANLATQSSESTYMESFSEIILKNKRISWLPTLLKNKYLQGLDATLIDNTGIRENIDIHIEGDMTNIQSINSALEQYGLAFIKDSQTLTVLTISDADENEAQIK